jgi:hypothetical protein
MLSLLKKLLGVREEETQVDELSRFRTMKSRSESVQNETERPDLVIRARQQKSAQINPSLLKKEERTQSAWNANVDSSMRVFDRRKSFK